MADSVATDHEPPRRRGRPKASDKGMPVTVWVRGRDYDQLLDLAKRHDKSLSGIMRDLLLRRLE